MKLSVSVMTHVGRIAGAERLATALAGLPVRVVVDPDPTGPKSTVRTAALAWKPWTDADHHMVIQDDAWPVDGFVEVVQRAVTERPDSLLSFFCEWGSLSSHAVRIAAYAHRPWAEPIDTYIPTQALSAPRGWAHQISEYLGTLPLDVPDDEAVYSLASERGWDMLISVPNLVQHDEVRSLIGNDFHGARRATVLPQSPVPAGWYGGDALTGLDAVPCTHWSSRRLERRIRPDRRGKEWPMELWPTVDGATEIDPDEPESALACLLSRLRSVAADWRSPAAAEVGAAWLRDLDQSATASLRPGVLRRPVPPATTPARPA